MTTETKLIAHVMFLKHDDIFLMLLHLFYPSCTTFNYFEYDILKNLLLFVFVKFLIRQMLLRSGCMTVRIS